MLYAECRFAEGRVLFIRMNVIMLSGVIPIVIIPSVLFMIF
jgi:hypothetical protein